MQTTTFSCGAGMDVFWMVMSSAILRRLVKVCGSLVLLVSSVGRWFDC